MDNISVPLNKNWFYRDLHGYLNSQEFKGFEEICGVPLIDLTSENQDKVRSAQNRLVQQCVILNEIQKQHFGYPFPLFVYTHSFDLFEKVPNHNKEVDLQILKFDMCDSLRRRHIALSHCLIPLCIDEDKRS